MPKKGENIRKRKDGRWEGRYKKITEENGKTIYGSVYGKSYKEVKEKLLFAKHLQTIGNIPKNTDIRFASVLKLWEETNQVRLKGGSKRRYDYLIKTHIIPKLGALKLSQITSSKINTFLNEKLNNGRIDGSGGLSASYVNGITVIVNAAINFAVAEFMCPPLRTPILKPHYDKKEIEILSADEQKKIENYVRKYTTSTGIGILITLYTGLRIGEICALSWKDIDFENEVIHVRHTVARVNSESECESNSRLIIDEPKTKASKRDIPISSNILELLSKYREQSKYEYVVSDKSGFTSPRTYEYRYHKILKHCGITSVNYHTLRHTFASRCVEVGVDIKSLSEILGHGNTSITLNTYVHSSIMQKKAQLEKLIRAAC